MYGETTLDGLNVIALSYFKGNIWAGETKASIAFFVDERADRQQRHALQMIFTGKTGGFMANFPKLIGDDRVMHFVPIKFEVADDLAYWSATIPGKATVAAEALTGPMTPPGQSPNNKRSGKRSRTWYGRDMGSSDIRRGNCSRTAFQLEEERELEQAHPIQLAWSLMALYSGITI